MFHGEKRDGASGATVDTITPSEFLPGTSFPHPKDDSRPASEFILFKKANPSRTNFGANPHQEYEFVPKPVLDEDAWANLDPSFRNLCPANLHGMEHCPAMKECVKAYVCTEDNRYPHVSIFLAGHFLSQLLTESSTIRIPKTSVMRSFISQRHANLFGWAKSGRHVLAEENTTLRAMTIALNVSS